MKIAGVLIAVLAFSQVQARTRIVDPGTDNDGQASTVVIFTAVAGGPFCSGVIIHPEWVLTSASCVKLTEQNDMRVIEELTAAIENDKKFDDALMIKKTVVHPNYTPATQLNDIGLIQIEDHMAAKWRIAKLPQVAPDLLNVQAVIRGYGGTGASATAPKQNGKSVFIVDNVNCNIKEIPMTNKICSITGATNNIPVACKGDEGGPLILKGTNTVVGITSLSEKHLSYCGMSIFLNFTPYTNVWAFKQWIQQTTGYTL